jgi:DNA-binding response OmpR family regulator
VQNAQDPVTRRKTCELRVSAHDVAGRVASSVLVLGHDQYSEASALTESLLHDGVDAAIARRVGDANAMNAMWHRDMVIIDADVVALDGLAALLAGLRARNPGLAMLLMTAWPPSDPRIVTAIRIVDGWYVMKPIDVAELVEMIRTVAVLRRTGVPNPLQRDAIHVA